MGAVLWGAALLLGFVLLYLLDKREKMLRGRRKELAERMEKRIIHALVVIAISIPVAYWLPRFGVGLDFVDIIVGACITAVSWIITGEIREEID